MNDVALYGLKNCDTCRKAMKALEGAGRSVTFVDIRNEADLGAKAPQWLARVRAEDLINKRSATWRGLTGAEQLHASDEDAVEELLAAHPTLIKRPVIEAGGETFVGWNQSVRHELGL